jgi:chemotaxis protein CheZ
VQRKVFRIEQTLAMGRRPAANARQMNGVMHDPSAPRPADNAPCMKRAAGELGAAVEGMEKAVQTILQSAEVIDEYAKALAVAHSNGHERKLAENVQDHLTRIYEACNFQDIAGQRIGKVIETLSTIDDRLARPGGNGSDPETAVERPEHSGRLLNGPRLDGETGTVSQRDIDAMFS